MPLFCYPLKFAAVAALITGCLASDTTSAIQADSSAVERPGQLEVFPTQIHLTGRDTEHGIIVLHRKEDGTVTDVTSQVQLHPDEPDIVDVTPGRQGVVALSDGTARVVVQFESLEAQVAVEVTRFSDRPTPSFNQDVLPVLTRAGCNMGGCHGKQAGQNGFRLSLRGYAPEWDHEWLTLEVNARRIDYAFPEESLVLRKATGSLPHEGGVRFKSGSRPYQTLHHWIAARAPGPVEKEPDVVRLEVLPGDRTMVPGEKQPLLVRAIYEDGRVRDVTWLAQFFSNDENTVSVTSDGEVTSVRHGEAGVRVHFQGLVDVVRFTMPFPHTIPAEAFALRQNAIDDAVFEKLRALGLPPAPLCSDITFLRRAYLDTIGVLPKPEEVQVFEKDSRPDRRARLVETLLERPEFTDYWTLQLADLLQNRRERDHDVRGQKGVRSFHQWLRNEVAENRPWNEIARRVLLAKGDVIAQPQGGYFITVIGEVDSVEKSELPDSVAQAFLGTRIGCARCHNHPLERYTQDDFYHFAAGFSKVHLDRKSPVAGASSVTLTSRREREQIKRLAEAATRLADACRADEPDESKTKRIADRQRELDEQTRRLKEIRESSPGVNQPRTGKFMAPRPLDGSTLKLEAGQDPRIPFVEWMLESDSFSGAMINRLWKHFFAVGLVEPVDDLRASNPPSNPTLWGLLNDEFRQSGFDLRHIIGLILNSRTYQLESTTTPENESESRYYSHYYPRRLPAEVLLDAIAAATDVPSVFPGHPVGLRAVQVQDPRASSYFLTLFGRSERVTACACERIGEVTLPQLLHLQNSEDLITQIRNPSGRLAALLKESGDSELIDTLFLATFTRLPTGDERNTITSMIRTGNREEAFADLLWALINSKEFSFNH